jgi:peptide/nickel transport system substrate-binding protein
MRTWRRKSLIATTLGLALVLTACGGGSEGAGEGTDSGEGGDETAEAAGEDGGDEPDAGGGNQPETLVVDKSFDLKTADPGRQFEVTGTIVGVALYDTLLTFEDADVTTPVPHLAESFEVNDDATEFTFELRDDVVFGDGSSLDAEDVAFSLNRVRNLKANGSFLMDGVTAEAVDEDTVVLRTEQPTPQLPRILPNPTLGILNSDLVIENGGTAGEDAAEADTAEDFLNSQSAGTGPYVLESFDTTTETVLAANPDYWGEPPVYERVVIRNVEAPTQALNVQSGQSHIVLDLAADQLSTIAGDPSLNVVQESSPNIWFLFANANCEVSDITCQTDFREAVRYGLDYEAILELAGDGAIRVPGIIPDVFLGALEAGEAPQRDVERAKAAVERLGGDVSVELEYPSDFTANGLNFGPVAERVKATLAEVGIDVQLKPNPIATALENYRNGQEQMGLWLWAPDYPDPADYLVFGPGGIVGLRAGWPAGSDPEIEDVMAEVATTVDDSERKPLFEEFQRLLNEDGVFFPLFQPTASVVARDIVGPVDFHPAWTIDLEAVGR